MSNRLRLKKLIDRDSFFGITPARMNSQSQATPVSSHYRWVICGLLFFATTFNYLDRQVISYLKEFFCRSQDAGGFGWSNSDFANLTSFFTAFYAGMSIIAGWIIDKIGTKIGLALSIIIWSVCGIANAFVGRLVAMHILVRCGFAVGEGGNFPASIKTIAEWFPKRERALATSIFNSGSNFGAMVAALFVPWCMVYFGDERGWKMAFILTGAAGFFWLIFWFWLYEIPAKQKRLSKAEFDYIHVDNEAGANPDANGDCGNISWFRLFTYPQTWALIWPSFMCTGIWWFYLFWLPDYLHKQFGMTGGQVTLPTFTVYGIAIVGSIYGGSIPLTLIKRGMSVYQARMTTTFILSLIPLIMLTTQYFGNVAHFGKMAVVLAVAVICIGAAAHQAYAANLYAFASDMFPKKALGSITGISIAFGGIGGVIIQKIAGRLTDDFKDAPQTAYLIMFIICALSYLVSWGVMKALVPRHNPVTDL
jgi:ACS family hexuronate transporter-like MFS transporter